MGFEDEKSFRDGVQVLGFWRPIEQLEEVKDMAELNELLLPTSMFSFPSDFNIRYPTPTLKLWAGQRSIDSCIPF